MVIVGKLRARVWWEQHCHNPPEYMEGDFMHEKMMQRKYGVSVCGTGKYLHKVITNEQLENGPKLKRNH